MSTGLSRKVGLWEGPGIVGKVETIEKDIDDEWMGHDSVILLIEFNPNLFLHGKWMGTAWVIIIEWDMNLLLYWLKDIFFKENGWGPSVHISFTIYTLPVCPLTDSYKQLSWSPLFTHMEMIIWKSCIDFCPFFFLIDNGYLHFMDPLCSPIKKSYRWKVLWLFRGEKVVNWCRRWIHMVDA